MESDDAEEILEEATSALIVPNTAVVNKKASKVDSLAINRLRIVPYQLKFKLHSLSANMDNDPQLEIILNTGIIIDSKFYNVEFEWDRSFGARIELFDINGDGIPEIWGENPDFTLRVFDRYAERDIW